MKRIEIRRPLIKALKKLGVDISRIPENVITYYVARIRRVLDENIAIWLQNRLYRSRDIHILDKLAKKLVNDNIEAYAAMLKRTFQEDVLAA